MSLRDLVDRKATIASGEFSFEVRGLSLEDMVLLMENHKDALVKVFVNSGGADFQELTREFPLFVAAAIAYAADEPDMEEAVRKMPLGLQLEAIQEVWELSSLDIESLGKLATSVLNGVNRLNQTDTGALMSSLQAGAENSQPAQNT